MALFDSYILSSKNTDKPVNKKRFIKEVVMALSKKTVPETPQAAESNKHELVHLSVRATRVCPICGKRSSWYCPGCNCGAYLKCFSQLKHFWRPLRGVKRSKPQEDSGFAAADIADVGLFGVPSSTAAPLSVSSSAPSSSPEEHGWHVRYPQSTTPLTLACRPTRWYGRISENTDKALGGRRSGFGDLAPLLPQLLHSSFPKK
ncbi:hypothetical protein J6590_002013 [Homalodisca vitripennis]|nr:hypothetical protein J6590_002013 [Homalodisca vitripennis]